MKIGPDLFCFSILALVVIVYIYKFFIDSGVFPLLILVAGYVEALFVIFKYLPIQVVLADAKIRGGMAFADLMDNDAGFGLGMLFVSFLFIFPFILAFFTASIVPGINVGINSFIIYSIIQVLFLFGADFNTDSIFKKVFNAVELALAAYSLLFSLVQTFWK